MFDINGFKKKIKVWAAEHPDGDINELIDFCEEQIPVTQFAANQWLIDQTVSWYKHILQTNQAKRSGNCAAGSN